MRASPAMGGCRFRGYFLVVGFPHLCRMLAKTLILSTDWCKLLFMQKCVRHSPHPLPHTFSHRPPHPSSSLHSPASYITRTLHPTMGKLNIAHHKSYHPYRQDNIARVRRDEEEARRKGVEEEDRALLAVRIFSSFFRSSALQFIILLCCRLAECCLLTVWVTATCRIQNPA